MHVRTPPEGPHIDLINFGLFMVAYGPTEDATEGKKGKYLSAPN